MANGRFPIRHLHSLSSGESFNKRLSLWMQKYEDFVGLSEVKAAQSRVLEAEKRFIKSQEDRREAQRQISTIQEKLANLHAELDRIPRGDDKYLALITVEHSVMKEDRRLREDFRQFENQERENFAALSHTLRDSHEKERAQAEKTKYWSIIGSVVGTMLGIIGTTFNNRQRMKELRNLVRDATNNRLDINVEELSKALSTVIVKNVNQASDGATFGAFSEQKWKDLQDSVLNLQNLTVSQHGIQLQQTQKLETLLVAAGSDTSHVRQYFVVKDKELEMLLNNDQDIKKFIVISSFLIPLCTWALCKFANVM